MNSDELYAAADRGSSGEESTSWWVVYLLQAYQAGYSEDRDPSTDGGGLAATEQSHFQVAAVFIEQIRDACVQYGYNRATLERQAVAHEIGHQILELGDSAHTINTIMQAALPVTPANERFSDAHIAAIRGKVSSPGN